jgi:hypothetical protein
MPDPFELPFRGTPYVDLRIWDRLYGNRSPLRRGGVWRMMNARIEQVKIIEWGA